jgi:hypothetical protein
MDTMYSFDVPVPMHVRYLVRNVCGTLGYDPKHTVFPSEHGRGLLSYLYRTYSAPLAFWCTIVLGGWNVLSRRYYSTKLLLAATTAYSQLDHNDDSQCSIGTLLEY